VTQHTVYSLWEKSLLSSHKWSQDVLFSEPGQSCLIQMLQCLYVIHHSTGRLATKRNKMDRIFNIIILLQCSLCRQKSWCSTVVLIKGRPNHLKHCLNFPINGLVDSKTSVCMCIHRGSTGPAEPLLPTKPLHIWPLLILL